MTREAALLALLADLTRDRDALVAQRDALKAENNELRAIVADVEKLAAKPDNT